MIFCKREREMDYESWGGEWEAQASRGIGSTSIGYTCSLRYIDCHFGAIYEEVIGGICLHPTSSGNLCKPDG